MPLTADIPFQGTSPARNRAADRRENLGKQPIGLQPPLTITCAGCAQLPSLTPSGAFGDGLSEEELLEDERGAAAFSGLKPDDIKRALR